jgi:hypothetical protein
MGNGALAMGPKLPRPSSTLPTTLRTVSLYEAVVVICPRALPYLAFPPGATIAVDDALSFFMNGEPLEIRKGSFVDAQRRQQQRGHSV